MGSFVAVGSSGISLQHVIPIDLTLKVNWLRSRFFWSVSASVPNYAGRSSCVRKQPLEFAYDVQKPAEGLVERNSFPFSLRLIPPARAKRCERKQRNSIVPSLRRVGATHRTQVYVCWWVTPTLLRYAVPGLGRCQRNEFRSTTGRQPDPGEGPEVAHCREPTADCPALPLAPNPLRPEAIWVRSSSCAPPESAAKTLFLLTLCQKPIGFVRAFFSPAG